MRTVFVLFVLFLLSIGGWAQQVSPEQAKEIAAQFLKANYARKNIKRNAPAVGTMKTEAVFDATDKSGQPYVYAVSYSKQTGYVLVSGDERFADVLGYSDTGNFDEQNMPENMREVVQGYIDEMKYLLSANYQPTKAPRHAPKNNIEPLMTTRWNQENPYNRMCPTDEGGRCLTGCAATAMAQVVNYHIQHDNGPTATIAEIPAYTTKRGINIPAIPAGSPLPDKKYLLDTYSGKEDAEYTDAVAMLSYYCGVSIKTEYNSSGSSSSLIQIHKALTDYFGFDNTARHVNRTDYTYAGWIDLFYDELAANRPVLLSGVKSDSGHAFVADGYDATNSLFHINWGWGGYADDYFALSVLNPNDAGQAGAASGTGGYTAYQYAIVGIQHVGAPGIKQSIRLTLGELNVDHQEVVLWAINSTTENLCYDISLGIYDNGHITQIGDIKTEEILYDSSMTVILPVEQEPAYANTTQKIVPIGKEHDATDWILISNPDIYYISAEYDADGVPALTLHPVTDFTSSFTVSERVYANTNQKIDVTLTNNGEDFYGFVYFFISTDANDKGEYVDYYSLSAIPGFSQHYKIYWKPDLATTYYIWATKDFGGNDVIATTEVEVLDDADITIASASDWDDFCDQVNIYGRTFEDKTVTLTASIGTAENPITTMVSTGFCWFSGTFDGGGHTLTVAYGSSDDRFSELYAAPFSSVEGATIQNLHVAGDIYTSKSYAAGLVGYAAGVTIENCRSSVTINSCLPDDESSYGYHGGLIADTYDPVSINGCLFDGSINSVNKYGLVNTIGCGGFIGWCDDPTITTITNSILKPSSLSESILENTFVPSNDGTDVTSNSYYVFVENMTENQGKKAQTISMGDNVASLAISGTPTVFDVSGITVYEGNPGLLCNGTVYAANEEVVSLALTANPPKDYVVDAYTASAGSITTNSSTSATLTMPDEDVTIGATFRLASGIDEIETSTDNINSKWYTLDGRRHDRKPSSKGIYIVNGKKIVIK